MSRSAHPNPSVPADLLVLYREHAHALPPISTLTADAMREALRAIGIDPPAPPPPARTEAATRAQRSARR